MAIRASENEWNLDNKFFCPLLNVSRTLGHMLTSLYAGNTTQLMDTQIWQIRKIAAQQFHEGIWLQYNYEKRVFLAYLGALGIYIQAKMQQINKTPKMAALLLDAIEAWTEGIEYFSATIAIITDLD